MTLIGLSWIVFWMIIQVFAVELIKAALIVGIIFLVLGLLIDGIPNINLKKQP